MESVGKGQAILSDRVEKNRKEIERLLEEMDWGFWYKIVEKVAWCLRDAMDDVLGVGEPAGL
jgi:hypothetical protein